jgi:hypothetical protein
MIMKNQLINYLGLFMVVINVGCYYDDPPEALPIDPEQISFSTHIVPILSNRCATSNCHDGTISPNLTAEAAYGDIRRLGLINLLFPAESELYKVVAVERSMPPGTPLSNLDQNLILGWIIKGALED